MPLLKDGAKSTSIEKEFALYQRKDIPITFEETRDLFFEAMKDLKIDEPQVLLQLFQYTHWHTHCATEEDYGYHLRPLTAVALLKA